MSFKLFITRFYTILFEIYLDFIYLTSGKFYL